MRLDGMIIATCIFLSWGLALAWIPEPDKAGLGNSLPAMPLGHDQPHWQATCGGALLGESGNYQKGWAALFHHRGHQYAALGLEGQRLDSLWRSVTWTSDIFFQFAHVLLGATGEAEIQQVPGVSQGWRGHYGLAAGLSPWDGLQGSLFWNIDGTCKHLCFSIQWNAGDIFRMELGTDISRSLRLDLIQSLRLSPNLRMSMAWFSSRKLVGLSLSWRFEELFMIVAQSWHAVLAPERAFALSVQTEDNVP